MPQEKKKRGRREQQKRKQETASVELVFKKPRLSSPTTSQPKETASVQTDGSVYDANADFVKLEYDRTNRQTDIPFFGLLDEEEQTYYANINSKLELDDFESAEDKAIFVEAVYHESEGKELKIACSQSCSRYLERLILISNLSQLKSLWGKFKGQFLNLVQHRFASHCCETLFLKSASEVSQEARSLSRGSNGDSPSVERLFLETAEELVNDLGYLFTERFASHTIRVLFVVLSGVPLENATTRSILASRKKESIDLPGGVSGARNAGIGRRETPKSFRDCFYRLKESATSSLSTTYLRALTTHPTGSPVLQLLLQIEGAEYRRTKHEDDDALLYRLFPRTSFEEESENGKFFLGLLYDPTGSRLLETVIQYAPGKVFKRIYSSILRKKLASIAKHDLASYVAIRALERIGKDDLLDAINVISPELPTLVARKRVGIIHVLVERSIVRALNTAPLANSIKSGYGNDYATMLPKMLYLDTEHSTDSAKLVYVDPKSKTNGDKATPIDPHGALLAQAMTRSPGFEVIIQAAILGTPGSLLIGLAKDPISSRVIQAALTAKESPLEFRRQLISKFYGNITDLSTHESGSYVVDCLWPATNDLHYMKEQIAQELSTNEAVLRESLFGRAVWRNWRMDSYRSKRGQWIVEAKSSKDTDINGKKISKGSKIDLARKRFAARHAK